MAEFAGLPTSPLPDEAAIKNGALKVLKDIGPEVLSMKMLLKLMAINMKFDFREHREMLDTIILNEINNPKTLKEMSIAAQAKEKTAQLLREAKKKKKAKKMGRKSTGVGSSVKKVKAEPDGPVVKRAQTAFMFFCSEKRPALIEAMRARGKVEVTQIAAELGEMWKKVSDSEKMPYEKLAAADKERAIQERASLAASANLEQNL